MINLLVVLAVSAVSGDGLERTMLHFSASSCSACREMQPHIDKLRLEGWSIRSVDISKNNSTREKWRVFAAPTLIVLANGVEVDRIEGAMSMPELRGRMKNYDLPRASPIESPIVDRSKPGFAFDSMYGPNHPNYQGRTSSNSSLGAKPSTALSETQLALIGPNHPLYAHYHPLRTEPKDTVRVELESRRTSKRRKTSVNPLLKDVTTLPALPECMAATVRIRVKYPESESVGTGTIIDVIGDQAIVITCGHLFRETEDVHPVTVELFQNGEVSRLPASVVIHRHDRIDLGLVKFRQPSRVSKVRIRPKSEELHELEPVFSIGCDRGADPSRRDSLISKLDRYVGPSNVEIAGAPIQGRSGGGLFDAGGRLVGICYASDEELDEGLFVGPESIYGELEKFGLNRLVDGSKQDE